MHMVMSQTANNELDHYCSMHVLSVLFSSLLAGRWSPSPSMEEPVQWLSPFSVRWEWRWAGSVGGNRRISNKS